MTLEIVTEICQLADIAHRLRRRNMVAVTTVGEKCWAVSCTTPWGTIEVCSGAVRFSNFKGTDPMIKKILLIDAEFDQNAEDGGQLQTKWTHHPLGLMYLTAYAHQQIPGLEIKIFHTVTVPDCLGHIKNLMAEFSPDLVGLRSLSLFQKQFGEIAEIVRAGWSDTIIVGGGPYVTASYESILSRGLVDIAVLEEGEVTFVDLIRRLEHRADIPDNVDGTALIVDGAIKVNAKRRLVSDLDSLPFPDYDTIRLDDYAGFSNHAFQSANQCAFIYSSRGCPYRCYYCHEALVKTVRRRSPDNVVEEIAEHYHRRSIRNFVFVDDIFNVPQKVGKEILRKIIDQMPDASLNFPNGLRADQLDDEFLDLLEAAGTVHMALAVETASPRLQKLIGKNLNIDKTREVILKASKRFVTGAFFMVGFPTETKEEAQATIDFAKDLVHLVQPLLSIVRVYPGLPLYSLLDPDEEQKRRIEQQSSAALQPKLHCDPSFYGDFFSDEEVPLKSDDIQELRWEWMRHVVHNPERIKNCQNILERHFDRENILRFYKNLYDSPEMSQSDLDRMLQTRPSSRSTVPIENGYVAATSP